MTDKNDSFALVPKPPGALENAEPRTGRILSGMVADTLALARKRLSKTARPLRIVIVNDVHDILVPYAAVLRVLLKNAVVYEFRDGAQAMRELARGDPDVLISDLWRQGLNGFEMLRLLRARGVTYPIVIASGTIPGTEAEARACAGPDLNVTYLQNPVRMEQWRRVLTKAGFVLTDQSPSEPRQPELS